MRRHFINSPGNLQPCRQRNAASRQNHICHPTVQDSSSEFTKVRQWKNVKPPVCCWGPLGKLRIVTLYPACVLPRLIREAKSCNTVHYHPYRRRRLKRVGLGIAYSIHKKIQAKKSNQPWTCLEKKEKLSPPDLEKKEKLNPPEEGRLFSWRGYNLVRWKL